MYGIWLVAAWYGCISIDFEWEGALEVSNTCEHIAEFIVHCIILLAFVACLFPCLDLQQSSLH